MGKKPRIINLSARPLILPFQIRDIKRLVIFPDYCPTRDNSSVGSVEVYNSEGHTITSDKIGQDAGCGMLLAKFDKPLTDLEDLTNHVASDFLANPRGKGSLGGGNHFVTFYKALLSDIEKISSGDDLVVIHSGSRDEGRKLCNSKLSGRDYLKAHDEAVGYARENRRKILHNIESASGVKAVEVLDKPHNFVEETEDEVIYRKGAVKSSSGKLGLLTSHMAGEAIIYRAKEDVKDVAFSLPHATGRKISRSEARRQQFFLDSIPEGVYIPYFISIESISTELPQCYRELPEVITPTKKYIEVVSRLKPRASIML